MLVAVVGASLASGTSAGAARAARACGTFSVLPMWTRYTYSVQVERGAVSCTDAMRTLYRAANDGSAAGWVCVVGQDRQSWAISCSRTSSVVRAYGPVAHAGTWSDAATYSHMVVGVPATTLGLKLESAVGAMRCGGMPHRPWVIAMYRRPDGATLQVAEGRPYTCGQLGAPARVAVWNIDGHAAHLFEDCAPVGCARITGEWALDWVERGMEVTFMTHGLSQHELLAIATSMSPLRP